MKKEQVPSGLELETWRWKREREKERNCSRARDCDKKNVVCTITLFYIVLHFYTWSLFFVLFISLVYLSQMMTVELHCWKQERPWHNWKGTHWNCVYACAWHVHLSYFTSIQATRKCSLPDIIWNIQIQLQNLMSTLLMEETLHHLGCIKPCK